MEKLMMFCVALAIWALLTTAASALWMAHEQTQLVAQQADQLELQRETVAMMRVQLNILREHAGPDPKPEGWQ